MHTQIPRQTARNFFLLLLMMGAVFVVLRPAISQDEPINNDRTRNIYNISIETSGAKLYMNSCASCHGTDGKGNGPAAASFKSSPTDLTLLSRMNGGEFPTDHIQYVLSNEDDDPAHGSKEMPVWGPTFRHQGAGGRGVGFLRCRNLTEYLKSIQVK